MNSSAASTVSSLHAPLAVALREYALRWPQETELAAAFVDLLDDADDPFRRERLAGHFTGSAFVVSADGARAALTHHAKLLRWLQPGGHADGDGDLAQVALREAQEETGLPGLVLHDGRVFDLDRHWIPERKGVPGHWHHDVRYVVRAGADEGFVLSDESLDLAWRPVQALACDPDPSLSRMARKWLALPVAAGP